jgi:hypothetical protein
MTWLMHYTLSLSVRKILQIFYLSTAISKLSLDGRNKSTKFMILHKSNYKSYRHRTITPMKVARLAIIDTRIQGKDDIFQLVLGVL